MSAPCQRKCTSVQPSCSTHGCVARNCMLILRWPFDVIDDEHVDGAFRRFESEAKLALEDVQDGCAGEIGRRGRRVIAREFRLETECSVEICFVNDFAAHDGGKSCREV